MHKFNHLDYAGDAILKLIAFELGIKAVQEWKWHKNKELAKLYDAIFLKLSVGMDRRRLRMSKSLHAEQILIEYARVNSNHGKASYVEAWLGEEYLRNGLESAKQLFTRMLEITGHELFE